MPEVAKKVKFVSLWKITFWYFNCLCSPDSSSKITKKVWAPVLKFEVTDASLSS